MTHALRARLHHLQFASPAPDRLAGFYADALDMTVTRDRRSWTCRGPKRCLVFVKGEAKKLISAGYGVRDREVLESLCARLASRQISIERTRTALFPEHSVTFRDPDGHQVSYGMASDDPVSSDQMSARLQHLVMGSHVHP
jgi:catechol 2,3-dioxygenase